MAHRRSGKAAAQLNSNSHCRLVARTRSSPSWTSSPSMATAVCEPLCGSTPINTFIVTPLVVRREMGDATVGTPDEEGALASFEPHRGRALAGWLLVQKPHPKRWAGTSRASPPDALDATS